MCILHSISYQTSVCLEYVSLENLVQEINICCKNLIVRWNACTGSYSTTTSKNFPLLVKISYYQSYFIKIYLSIEIDLNELPFYKKDNFEFSNSIVKNIFSEFSVKCSMQKIEWGSVKTGLNWTGKQWNRMRVSNTSKQ